MGADSNVAPVIIKRKKVVGGGGHHGGAWKVAYADFVTAMMAFFMLMWLLNATTEKQRKGLADYFNPTIAVARISGGGTGMLGGDSTFSEMTMPQAGTGATSEMPTERDAARGSFTQGEAQDAEEEALRELEQKLLGRTGESALDDGLMRHIVTRLTDEGLVVELYETAESRLFDDRGRPTPLLERLAAAVARVADMVSNPVAVEGHVRAYPIVLAKNPAWDESAQHAGHLRDLLWREGLDRDRVARVTAHADRDPAHDNPMDPRNTRLEVIFLRDR